MGDSVMAQGTLDNVAQLNQSVHALWDVLLAKLPGVGLGLILFALFILVSGPVSRVALRPFKTFTRSPLIRSVVQRALAAVIIMLGCYLFLRLAGLTGFAVAIMSGTGILGLILGFAFRDIAENFISSLLLTVQRPFRLGDIVQINGYTGVVQKVTARATTLVDFDGNHIQLTNATIYKGTIKNLTANPRMRGNFVIGIGYDNAVEEAQAIAVDILSRHPYVLKEPEPLVLVDNLGAATLNIRVYFWINVETTSVQKMASVLMKTLVETYLEKGISMPDDAREVIFPQGIPLSTEQFKAKEEAPKTREKTKDVINELPHFRDDVSSEANDIRKQADVAREPESGHNIL